MLRPRMTPCLDRAPYVDGCGLFALHVGIVFHVSSPGILVLAGPGLYFVAPAAALSACLLTFPCHFSWKETSSLLCLSHYTRLRLGCVAKERGESCSDSLGCRN